MNEVYSQRDPSRGIAEMQIIYSATLLYNTCRMRWMDMCIIRSWQIGNNDYLCSYIAVNKLLK